MDPISNNIAAKRFELSRDGHTAVVEYRLFDGGIAFLHTEVPPPLEGKGIATALAKYVLEYAKANDLKVLPLCPYIKKYIERHSEYQSLVVTHS